MKTTRRLRELLSHPDMIVAPGAYDGITARLVEQAGFSAVYMTGAGTILLLAIPFIPGLRDIPRLIPVHKLIWRHWDGSPPEPGAGTGQASPQSPDHVKS